MDKIQGTFSEQVFREKYIRNFLGKIYLSIYYSYYFFNNIINLKNFDRNKIKTDEKSHKDILIFYTGHVTIKDLKYVKINSIDPLNTILSTK